MKIYNWNKKKDPCWLGVKPFWKGYKFSWTTASTQSQNKNHIHPGFVQHQIFSFTLHYASYWKHSVACKIYILANACYVLMCPNWYLADLWGKMSWISRAKKEKKERKKQFSLQFCCLNNHVLVFCGEKKLALMRGKRTEMWSRAQSSGRIWPNCSWCISTEMLSDVFLLYTVTIKAGWGLWVNVFAGHLIIIPTFIKLGWFMAG